MTGEATMRPPMPRYPPAEPAPGTEHLTAPVDWLSYSHEELYRMVNDGLDLPGAVSVAAQWATIGDSLRQIADVLRKAAADSEHGWQGQGADRARAAVSHLVGWLDDTWQRALGVSGCVSRQAENAETARRTMPTPPARTGPAEGPVAHPAAAAARGATTANSFSAARDLVQDPAQRLQRQAELHQQAADVMQRLQASSSEVYRTIPAFTRPTTRPPDRGRVGRPPGPPSSPASPTPAKPGPQPDDRTDAQSVGSPASAGAGGPVPQSPPLAEAPGAPGMDGGRATTAGPGDAAGAGVVRSPSAAGAAAAAQNAGARAVGGGVPMGPGMRRERDRERRSPSYLEESEDIWGPGEQVTPPVIGEERR